MEDVCFENFKPVGDNEVCLALPFGSVSGAAPAVSICSSFEMLVESEVVQTKVDPSAGSEVELNCGKKAIVSNKLWKIMLKYNLIRMFF